MPNYGTMDQASMGQRQEKRAEKRYSIETVTEPNAYVIALKSKKKTVLKTAKCNYEN